MALFRTLLTPINDLLLCLMVEGKRFVGMLFFVTRLIAIGYLVIRADVVTRNTDCNWASNQ